MKIVIDSFSGCKANTADVGFIGLEYCKSCRERNILWNGFISFLLASGDINSATVPVPLVFDYVFHLCFFWLQSHFFIKCFC